MSRPPGPGALAGSYGEPGGGGGGLSGGMDGGGVTGGGVTGGGVAAPGGVGPVGGSYGGSGSFVMTFSRQPMLKSPRKTLGQRKKSAMMPSTPIAIAM
ncbi:hypothetical protein CS0771_05980 [Catellatospora sp. IY07-71]|nr:hypothetical protein CS0771_05980 [Catellatospora sp. IY07-71]